MIDNFVSIFFVTIIFEQSALNEMIKIGLDSNKDLIFSTLFKVDSGIENIWETWFEVVILL